MPYRLIIHPASGHRCQCEFWFESKRTAPDWMPRRLARWWTRWRRISSKKCMTVGHQRIAQRGLIVPLETWEKVEQLRAKFDKVQT